MKDWMISVGLTLALYAAFAVVVASGLILGSALR